MQLRDYQNDLINKTRASMGSGKRAPLIVSPCGSGKTVMFSYFANAAALKGNHVLILAHRHELLDQISETLKQFKVYHSFIAANRYYNPKALVQVGSVQTVVRRLGLIQTPRFIIVDEAHHCAAGTSYHKIIQTFKPWVVGVSASPRRLSGEPLGDVFDEMIMGPSVSELIERGHLCKYRLFAPPPKFSLNGVHKRGGDYISSELENVLDKPRITGDCIEQYNKHLKGKRAVVFCTSIKHAEHVASQFASCGITSAMIEGKTETYERNKIVRDFRENRIKILTNVNIATEGFDVPDLDGVIQLRPTQSLVLYTQMVGRVLRKAPGKTEGIILDQVNNYASHGMPDDDHQWTLKGIEKQKNKSDSGESVRVCPMCFAAQFSGKSQCVFCGHVFEIKSRKIDEVDGDLEEIKREHLRKLETKKKDYSAEYSELLETAIKRGYKRPHFYVRQIMQSRQAKKLRGGA